jgi:hypothetical protein
MKKLILAFTLCFPLIFLSQEKSKEQLNEMRNASFTIRGTVGIPRAISSNMFRTCFNGVYAGNLSFNFRLFNNVFVGVGYDNSHFLNNKKVFTYYIPPSGQKEYGLSYNTRIMAHAGFVKIGGDKFFSNTGYMSYSVNSGLMAINYVNVEADTNLANRPYGLKMYYTPYVQPEMAVNFIVGEERTLSLSIMLAYTTVLSNFDPKGPRFNHISEVKSKSNNYFMSWLNIGFGFNVLINRKQKTAG